MSIEYLQHKQLFFERYLNHIEKIAFTQEHLIYDHSLVETIIEVFFKQNDEIIVIQKIYTGSEKYQLDCDGFEDVENWYSIKCEKKENL